MMNLPHHHHQEGHGAPLLYSPSEEPEFEGHHLFKVLSEIPLIDPSSPDISQNHPNFSIPSQFIPYGEEEEEPICNPLQQSSTTIVLDHHSLHKCEGLDGNKKQPYRLPRSAQTHNLAERNRRSRLKEKIQTLKEILPNCDKTDADSILPNAINYVESSKLQLQWMSDALKYNNIRYNNRRNAAISSGHLPRVPSVSPPPVHAGLCYYTDNAAQSPPHTLLPRVTGGHGGEG